MKEKKWLGSTHLYTMIRFLEQQKSTSSRRLLLFGCACCRQVWDLLDLEVCRRIVELSEAYADGEVEIAEVRSIANSHELDFAEPQALRKSNLQLSARVADAYQAVKSLAASPLDLGFIAQNTSRDKSRDFVLSAQNNFGIGIAVRRDEAEFAEKVKLLRDIFGNPFRPVPFNPTWRTDHTVRIAKNMYDERNFDAMASLADELEEAGCDQPAILNHCREPGVHVRGCWVVDLVLGKE